MWPSPSPATGPGAPRSGSSGRGLTSSALRLSSRPVSDGSRIYVYKPNGEVVALSTGGGRQWTAEPAPRRRARCRSRWRCDRCRRCCLCGDQLSAAGCARGGFGPVKSGQVDIDTPARGAPVAGAGHVFVVTQSNEVYALNQSDGSVAWTYAGIEETAGLLSAANPAISGNRVIVPFSSGEIMAINIKDGEPAWIDGVSRAVSGRSPCPVLPMSPPARCCRQHGLRDRRVRTHRCRGRAHGPAPLGAGPRQRSHAGRVRQRAVHGRSRRPHGRARPENGETLWATARCRVRKRRRSAATGPDRSWPTARSSPFPATARSLWWTPRPATPC